MSDRNESKRNLLNTLLGVIDEAEEKSKEQIEKLRATEEVMRDSVLADIKDMAEDDVPGACAALLETMLADAGQTLMLHGLKIECSCIEQTYIMLDFLLKTVLVPALRTHKELTRDALYALVDEATKARIAKFDMLKESGVSGAEKLRTILATAESQLSEKH